MFLPYNTDAPVYHWPAVTVGLIVVNGIVFAASYPVMLESPDWGVVAAYTLQFGQGLQPIQWLTSNFLHLDFLHLLGNMFGLWAFGLIVEGKIGWWRFLTVYLLIGIGTMMTLQVLGQGREGCALGASGAIFGLMGIALIWAPQNEVSCVVFFGFRSFLFDMTVWAMAILYLGIQLLIATMTGFAVSSELIHLIGGSLGIAAGIVMLRCHWVDCENWDVFSVWAGRHQMSRDELAAAEAKVNEPSAEDRLRHRGRALEQIHQMLVEGRVALALAAHRKMARTDPDWTLPEEDQRRLIAGSLKQSDVCSETIVLMRDYLARYHEYAAAVRLKLAELLIEREQRPAQARRVLSKIDDRHLTPPHRAYRGRLAARAQKMIDEGTLEVQVEDW